MGIFDKFRSLFYSSAKAAERKPIQAKLNRYTKWETELQINTFEENVKLAEDLLIPDRKFLLGHYDEFVKDGHVSATIGQRKNKVLAEPFAIYDDNGNVIDDQTDLLLRPWFEKFLSYSLDEVFFGHSLIELLFDKGSNMVHDCAIIPRDHVRPEYGHLLPDATNFDNHWEYRKNPLLKNKLIEVIRDARFLGSLLTVGKYVIYKKYAHTDWSRHSERYGSPMMVAFTNTIDKESLDQKEEFLRDFGHNGYALLNEGDKVELLESAKTDPFKIYLEQLNYCNSEISKALLGQTGTTDEKSFVGSAEVHERVLDDFLVADMRRIKYVVNDRLIPSLQYFGYNMTGLFDWKVNHEEDKAPSVKQEGKDPQKKKMKETELSALYDLAPCGCPDHSPYQAI